MYGLVGCVDMWGVLVVYYSMVVDTQEIGRMEFTGASQLAIDLHKLCKDLDDGLLTEKDFTHSVKLTVLAWFLTTKAG